MTRDDCLAPPAPREERLLWLSLRWLARAVVAAVFVYAGGVKVLNPALFVADIESFHMLPSAAALFVAFFLPWLEIIAGLALLIPSLRWSAGMILLALLLAFMVGIGQAMVRGIDISCGCFGGDGSATAPIPLLLRDVALIVGTLIAMGPLRRQRKTMERPPLDVTSRPIQLNS